MYRDLGIFLLMAASGILIALPVQLVLCFKAKKLLFKLLPAIVLAAASSVFYILMITARDWSALVYLIFVAFALVMLIFSGIGWGIWAIVKKRNATKTIE